ncbi:MAG: 16S rRNA (cytosine(1402)-N(4))-methyltransferase RsmH [Leptospirales bacterium]|nr:16S rRNA (cytosine(1402)-N(4))-methyltransferase RsmH [Leptospirales bacterium]
MRHNADTTSIVHTPVLWKEVLFFVQNSLFHGSGLCADCTLGEGGHTELLLSNFPEIKVIAFERDPDILAIAQKRLEAFSGRVEFVNSNFSEISQLLAGREPRYILFDYGVSSYHFDKSGRGFSFRSSEPLDMRLDKKGRSAAEILSNSSERELADIFFHYGEERWSKKIAAYIVKERVTSPFTTTEHLASVVMRAIPRRFHVKNIHPATRVFQALRIAVNAELDSISSALDGLWEILPVGGRVMAISFHSLEDRLVKKSFRDWARGCSCGLEGKACMCTSRPFVSVLTKRPVTPSDEEINLNRRARGAKIRVCERVAP